MNVRRQQRRGLAISLLALLLTACGFMRGQVAVMTANECIAHQCTSEQGVARQRCETECLRKYGN